MTNVGVKREENNKDAVEFCVKMPVWLIYNKQEKQNEEKFRCCRGNEKLS